MSNSVWPHRQKPTRLSHPWDSPGKNTGVGCHFLLQCVKVKSLSCLRLFTTPWTAAYQAPLSLGFSRQEYWGGLPLPSPHFCLYTYKNLTNISQYLDIIFSESLQHVFLFDNRWKLRTESLIFYEESDSLIVWNWTLVNISEVLFLLCKYKWLNMPSRDF